MESAATWRAESGGPRGEAWPPKAEDDNRFLEGSGAPSSGRGSGTTMSTSSSVLLGLPGTHPGATALTSLSELRVRQRGRIASIEVDVAQGPLLRAMGITEGQTVLVLRRAPAGDPLHIRLGCGGEFALAASLARAIHVEFLP